ncbi:MAG: hypothetical protein ACTSVL_10310, partial [Promethearchaeota archaeon]
LERLKSKKTQKSPISVKSFNEENSIQSVEYNIIDAMDMTYDELNKEQSERVKKYAKIIVEYFTE